MKASIQSAIKDSLFLLISAIGGLILTLAGLSIGWMIGTLITAGALALLDPKPLRELRGRQGMNGYWLKIGQLLLGIQIGHQVHVAIFNVLRESWLLIIAMIILSVILSLLSGFILYCFSSSDLVTSLYGTTPGGLSAMIGIAADSGANMAAVSLIQTVRVILVESTVPLIVSVWSSAGHAATSAGQSADALHMASVLGFAFVLVVAALSAMIGGKIGLPAPWLIGGMIAVAAVQLLFGFITDTDLPVWQPQALIVIAQVMIGACVGARLNRGMFRGIGRIFLIGLAGSIGLTAAMFLCALLVSALTSIDPITSILAFAPGGIDVMAVTSEVLHADSTFVVAVQVLRVLAICILLPPFFSLIHSRRAKSAAGKVSSR